MTTNKYSEGQFCWTELTTPDLERARKFYVQLFHWKVDESPMPQGGIYCTAIVQTKPTGAMQAMSEQEAKNKVPAHWREYVWVSHVDETTAKATAAGGTVLVPAFDVMNHGRMSIIADPSGAALALWQPRDHQGADFVSNGHGVPCWWELMTTDVESAKTFYSKTLGWEYSGNSDYIHIHTKGNKEAMGGMMAMPPHMKGTPSYWGHYFNCNDVDTTTKIAKELGAKICMEPTEIKDTGRFSVCADPTGAMFCLFTTCARHATK